MNSHQREEPQDPWEQQRFSSGESRNLHQMIHSKMQQRSSSGSPEDASANVQDYPMGEEVVDLWEAEDPPDDDDDSVVEQATRSSISASNP